MMTTFIASGVIPAYVEFSKLFNISLQKASYFTSAQILFLGLAPFFWKPVSNRFGRRPVWLVSTLCSMVCNIGCAESKSYGAMMVCRILVAIFISPPVGIGSGVVTETFFQHERGQKMGIWTCVPLPTTWLMFSLTIVDERAGCWSPSDRPPAPSSWAS